MPPALDIFLWVASICAIILTVLAVALAAVLIRAALEVRVLVRRAQQEVAWLSDRRRQLVYSARFAGKWLRLMSGRLIR